ncbi:H/ACA ribonucleoprotein complex subunit GAR1 [Methanothermobacter wolfeii]|uniref:H/ACA ribonucleoprotein complex subunit GAR1 n=1 Tax=Methanothermobacter wolfeii TaxID=145261 RepID=UPI0024B392A8|nr:Gar1/Naf1 family protein [Methanothermobacter wolfeii]MDI6702305.1 Gar1/Naf1 family protein [Methanothermobacter wolfeii]MDI6842301.1 Gar1/Naf1 family protein [Methanothermobacter wolfeii]
MKILGNISHISNRGRIIARSERTPKLGAPVFTSDGKRIGSVHDIFGPTRKPYISIKTGRAVNTEKFEKRVGETLYEGIKNVKKWGRRKRRKK